MTPPHSTDQAVPNTDPCRWDQSITAHAYDHFSHPDHGSQRQYAREHGSARATLGDWLRDDRFDNSGLEPEVIAFFRSAAGLRFLRKLVLALFLVFVFGAACGLRRLSLFLRWTRLDCFVAASSGALHELGHTIQTDLAVFADEERPRLAKGMKHRHIALVPDENFHGNHVCLVAAEPASNFLFVEQYADRRDEATWTAAINEGLTGLPVTVLLLSSDRAKGLIACAHNGLEAQHLAELFHGQRDLCQPLMGPLERQKATAQKELQQAEQLAQACRVEAAAARSQPAGPGRPKDYDRRIAHSQAQVEECTRKVEEREGRQEQALAAVRGLADDYHPFDSRTGVVVEGAEICKRLGPRLKKLEQVAEQAELGGQAQEALARGQRWLLELVAAMHWFWSVARLCVEELDLSEEVERAMYERLLPGLYWQQAAKRARTAEQRHEKAALAERLLKEAWAAGGVLSRLTEEEQQDVKRVASEVAGLFARSSSCVEGRNGRLALFHHGQTRLSAGRLKALTVIHNYVTERADGTTAAERFFGKKPRDLFSWLLQRLPNLPRPAAKRPSQTTPTTAKAG
jgi:Family of unknown function (DUF6399)